MKFFLVSWSDFLSKIVKNVQILVRFSVKIGQIVSQIFANFSQILIISTLPLPLKVLNLQYNSKKVRKSQCGAKIFRGMMNSFPTGVMGALGGRLGKLCCTGGCAFRGLQNLGGMGPCRKLCTLSTPHSHWTRVWP